MPLNDVYNEYNRLNDPVAQEQELRRRLTLANPYLQNMLSAVRSDLSGRGLNSAAPMARAGAVTTGKFTTDISQNFFADLDRKKMGLLELMTQIEEFKAQMKAQKDASKWGALGQALGLGASFLMPTPQVGG